MKFNDQMSEKKHVLILTSAREPRWIDDAPTETGQGLHDFINGLNAADEGVNFAVTTLDKLDFIVENGVVSIFDRYNQKDLTFYDLVHFRNVTLFPDYARAIALYMHHAGKQTLEQVDTTIPEYGKLSQMVLFAQNNVAVPDTWAAWNVRDVQVLIESKELAMPFVLKANDGVKGHDNYLVRTHDQLEEIIAENSDIRFVAQAFIPNDGDYRVLYFADNDPLIFKRVAAEGSHLNNTSRGGSSEEIAMEHFDQVALTLAHTAATLTQRSLAGVDAIQDNSTGRWLILEVNANPALSSGALLSRKIAGYKSMIKDVL